MSGAPRTTMVRIARAASSTLDNSDMPNSNGSRDWSMTRTTRSCVGQMVR
jgi:hypothetical protein